MSNPSRHTKKRTITILSDCLRKTDEHKQSNSIYCHKQSVAHESQSVNMSATLLLFIAATLFRPIVGPCEEECQPKPNQYRTPTWHTVTVSDWHEIENTARCREHYNKTVRNPESEETNNSGFPSAKRYMMCLLDDDICTRNPPVCQNGGTCSISNVDGYDEFECICRVGFAGRYCQFVTNPCFQEPSPCQHGGKCTTISTRESDSYVCNCRDGFEGENCEVPICGPHSHWEPEASKCVNTCAKPYAWRACATAEKEGRCVCDYNSTVLYVRSGDQCIDVRQCGVRSA